MSITSESFGTTAEGTPIERYTLTNAHGLEAAVITYGGIMTALRVPDRNGEFGDIVLGFDTLTAYLGDQPFFGALVGRFCNRIADAQFMLNGTTYLLARNDGLTISTAARAAFTERSGAQANILRTRGRALSCAL